LRKLRNRGKEKKRKPKKMKYREVVLGKREAIRPKRHRGHLVLTREMRNGISTGKDYIEEKVTEPPVCGKFLNRESELNGKTTLDIT